MTQGQVTIELGDRRFVVTPQKLPRLKRRLNTLFDSLGEANLEGASGLLDVLADKGYEVLEALTGGPPAMLTRDEWDSDEHAATLPQVLEAVKSAAAVNGLTSFKALGNVISPELIRALINQQMTTWVANSLTRSSTSSGSTSGDSQSTGGTTTPPTSPASTEATESRASPSLEPSSSSESATGDAGGSTAPTQ